MVVDINGNWKIYWGAIPLPQGAEPIGTVDGGSLLLMQTGIYVKGNAGSISSLDQTAVKKTLGISVHGGKRPGAGAKKTVAKPLPVQSIRCTDDEKELIKEYLKKIRSIK